MQASRRQTTFVCDDIHLVGRCWIRPTQVDGPLIVPLQPDTPGARVVKMPYAQVKDLRAELKESALAMSLANQRLDQLEAIAADLAETVRPQLPL